MLEEQQRKTQELRDRLTPENIGNQEKIEYDIRKAKIRKKDIQQEFCKRLASAEAIQVLEGMAGKLTEDEMRKVQLREIKLEARLRKLISAHNLVMLSYELDPMLEVKYQTLKQNIYNEIATCEAMLDLSNSQLSDHEDDMREEIEKPSNSKVTLSMNPMEKEFRERLDSMERDDEVPTSIDPKTISEKDFYYLLIKRCRTVSDIELLNHMYGAVQAIGNLDADTMDRYQAAKRKGTKIVHKCNELLDAIEKETDNSSQEPKNSSTEDIPKKLSKEDNIVNQESLRSGFDNQNQTVPKEGFESITSNKQKESSNKPKGGFGFHPDSGKEDVKGKKSLKLYKK